MKRILLALGIISALTVLGIDAPNLATVIEGV